MSDHPKCVRTNWVACGATQDFSLAAALMGAKTFFHTHRSTMCGLKKLASGIFPESWKVLAERRRRRKWTKNNKSPRYLRWLNYWWNMIIWWTRRCPSALCLDAWCNPDGRQQSPGCVLNKILGPFLGPLWSEGKINKPVHIFMTKGRLVHMAFKIMKIGPVVSEIHPRQGSGPIMLVQWQNNLASVHIWLKGFHVAFESWKPAQ